MLIDFEAIRRLFRQQNLVGVLPFAFMLLGKNFFEPMGLMLSDCLIHIFRIVKDDKFLTAIVTAKSTHLCKAGRTLPRLTLLYRYCSHRLLHFIETLIEAVIDSMSAMGILRQLCRCLFPRAFRFLSYSRSNLSRAGGVTP